MGYICYKWDILFIVWEDILSLLKKIKIANVTNSRVKKKMRSSVYKLQFG